MRFELPNIRDALLTYPEDLVKRAARSTLNQVGPSARQVAMDEIRKIWNIQESLLKERMTYSAARMWALQVEIVFGGRSISLSYFDARQYRGASVTRRTKAGDLKTTRSRGTGPQFAGVQLNIERGKSTVLARAFMQKMKSGHIGIFVRKGKARYPILHKDAISIASMVEQDRVRLAVITQIETRMLVVFPHELEYYITQWVG